jgi:general secretion pathway protein G
MATGKHGFTLIEVLVVLTIISIVAVIMITVVDPVAQLQKSRDVRRKSDLDQVKKALLLYYNDHQQYPDAGEVSWGDIFEDEIVYMKRLPQDPSGSPEYSYVPDVTGQDFCLSATLERGAVNDPDIDESQAFCNGCSVGGDDYVVCAN